MVQGFLKAQSWSHKEHTRYELSFKEVSEGFLHRQIQWDRNCIAQDWCLETCEE